MVFGKLTISYVAILCSIIFVLNQILLNIGISWFFTKSYLDDFLCFPIAFFIIQWIHRKSNNEFILPIHHILISIFLFSIFFEIILPLISIKYTSDILDVFFYLIGGALFYFFNSTQNEVEKVQSQP